MIPFQQHRSAHREGEGNSSREFTGRGLGEVEVLLVEDDFIVAFDMQSLLEEQGAIVVGPAADLREATVLFNQSHSTLRVAVLDVNLAGEHVFPLAERLKAVGIPFVFVTAYADDERLFPETLRDAPRLSKPVLPNTLLGQLRRLLGV